MKKFAAVLVSAVLVLGLTGCGTPTPSSSSQSVSSGEERETNFRGSAWGDTADQIILAEGSEPYEQHESGIMYVDQSVYGYDCAILFSLSDGELHSGLYSFTHKHTNDNLYIEDYKDLKKALTEKYGSPVSDKENWYNDMFKDDPNNYGLAVAAGDLEYQSLWDAGDTKILLSLRGDNLSIKMAITYIDANHDGGGKDTAGL